MGVFEKLIEGFLNLPAKYNSLAESRNAGSFEKAYFVASITGLYGEPYTSPADIEGALFELTVVFDPISEEAEVRNNIASFTVEENRIRNISYLVDFEESIRPDLALTEMNCSILLWELEDFCRRSLPEDSIAHLDVDSRIEG